MSLDFKEAIAKNARTFLQIVQVKKFNPYHGKDGRFTSGGAGGAAFFMPKNEKHKQSYLAGQRINQATGTTKIDQKDIAKGEHSISKYLDKDGKLTPEREAIHEAAVYKFLEGVQKAEGQPTYYMMGGGPAAGKSTVIKSGQVDVPDSKKAVVVDVDECKKLLPEYNAMVKAGNPEAAGYCHEESSALAKRIISVAEKNGYNVVLDGTGDGSEKGVMKKIDEARSNGMKVVGVYVTCDTDAAVARAVARGEKTGRVVNEEVVRSTHAKVSQILPNVADKFDSVQLFDTNSGGAPKLIASGGSGKKLTVEGGNQAEYDSFIAKGGK